MFGVILAGNPAPFAFAQEIVSDESVLATSTEETSADDDTATDEEGGDETASLSGEEGEAGEEGEVGEEGAAPEGSEEDEVDGAAGTSIPATDDATTDASSTAATTSDSTIITGHAGAVLNASTHANTNKTDAAVTQGTSTTPSAATSTDPERIASSTVAVESENAATSTNDLDVDVQSGENAATSTGTTTIDTGDAVARISFENIVNTNIVNSEGLMLFLETIGADTGKKLDLRNTFDDIFRSGAADGLLTAESTCALISCNSTLEELFSNENDAVILNDLIVRSGTGANTAYAGNGCAAITTGDSYTAVSGLNMANTNIIDSSYLLVSMNNFGDLHDDIVFPGFEFFQGLMGKGIAAGSNISVENQNDATVDNDIVTDGTTGENTAVGSSSTITTGSVDTDVRVRNEVNQNIFGGSKFHVLIRVFGDWDGDVYGLPDGLVWQQTAEGIEIMTDPDHSGGATAIAGNAVASTKKITNDNTAVIDNNIEIYALTGKNHATAGEGCANIDTGDVNIDVALTNMANTNVVGANWIKAIFNVFGNWTGDVAFGRPDLWIGGRADAIEGGFRPDGKVRYTFTVTNFGDSPARDIILTPDFAKEHLSFLFDTDQGSTTPELELPLGDLLPGESIEVTMDAKIAGKNILRNLQNPIDLTATVESREKDNNYETNTEQLTIVVLNELRRTSSREYHPYDRMGDSDITLEKKLRSASTMSASSSATFEVVIKNEGGPSYESLLHDVLFDEDDKVIHHQIWELELIEPDEEIYISYDVFFKASTPSGIYRNEVFVQGVNNAKRVLRGNDDWSFETEKATAQVEVIALEIEEVEAVEEQVLGAYCEKYMLSPVRWGASNSLAEVAKLQTFLNKYEGAELTINGVYDQATFDAVKAFQVKYAIEILHPWNVYQPTGYVYHTTMRKINEVYCEGIREFPLSPEQLREIEAFKARPEEFGEVGGSIESLGIGYEPSSDRPESVLAEAEPAGTEEDDAPTQTATVNDAVESARDAGASMMERLRERLNSFMNWVSVKYRDARLSSVSKRD